VRVGRTAGRLPLRPSLPANPFPPSLPRVVRFENEPLGPPTPPQGRPTYLLDRRNRNQYAARKKVNHVYYGRRPDAAIPLSKGRRTTGGSRSNDSGSVHQHNGFPSPPSTGGRPERSRPPSAWNRRSKQSRSNRACAAPRRCSSHTSVPSTFHPNHLHLSALTHSHSQMAPPEKAALA
jgi:hypothetical protein